jgi:crotonobetainyl-CoA:carnitine CoA-transferase CaiB-like acyl-CoA transferase
LVLKGLKVIDFSAYIAGPGAAGMLSDWGADVIKVERPGGDAMRYAFSDIGKDLDTNPAFELDNRGKRGIVLDISKDGGRGALIRLVAQADVFLTSVRPASLRKHGLDFVSLSLINPRLVYAVVTGYGLTGPEAHRPGFDVTAFWARAGVAAQTAPKGSEPFLRGAGIGDHATSIATAAGILAALYERHSTGTGRLVETSLLGVGTYLIGQDLSVQLAFGRLASIRPRERPFNPLSNYFRSMDDRWFVHNDGGGGRSWRAFAAAAGREDLIEDERFSSAKARHANGEALTEALFQGFVRVDSAEIERRLDAAGLAWAWQQTAAEVVADPQVNGAGLFVEIGDAESNARRSPAPPARFPAAPVTRRAPAPRLGEHTRDVLATIDYDTAAIDRLFADGAVA